MIIEKKVKQLEFEFMKDIGKKEKRQARRESIMNYIFLATLAIITPFALTKGIQTLESVDSHIINETRFLDDSKIIKGDYSKNIEKVPYFLRPYVSVGFPYF